MTFDQELHSELLRRRDLDQRIRRNAPGGKWTTRERDLGHKIDDSNTRWLAGVVRRVGWPGIARVGEDGAHAAWLLAQHADRHPDRQREFLSTMRRALAAGQTHARYLAYLEDRVLVNAGQEQIFGTQYHETEIAPIRQPEMVDERRAAVGLPPLAEYDRQMRELNNL
jgi:hypothetical protein